MRQPLPSLPSSRPFHSRLLPGCLLAVLLSTAALADAQTTKIYQWKDAKGVSHFTDTPPPPEAKATNRNIASKGGDAPPPAQAKVSESPQCTQSRYNLQVLSSGAPVQEGVDANGKPKLLSADERASRKALAESGVANFCKPPETSSDNPGT